MRELTHREFSLISGGFIDAAFLTSFVAGKNNMDYDITKANGRTADAYIGAATFALWGFPYGLILSPITAPLGYGIGYVGGHVMAVIGYKIGTYWQDSPTVA